MANENEKERLTLEQELIQMLKNRQVELHGINQRHNDISINIQNELRDTQLTVKEKQKIQSITNHLVAQNSKLKLFATDQLGTRVKERQILEQIKSTEGALAGIQRQKLKANKLEGDAKKAALKDIEKQENAAKGVIKTLHRQRDAAKEIANNKIADSFGNVGKTLKNIPGLGIFSDAFDGAGKAASLAKQQTVNFSKGFGDASQYTKANLAKLGKNAEVVGKSGKALFGSAAKKALEAGTAQVKGVNMTMLTAKAGMKSLAISVKAIFGPLAMLMAAIKAGFQFDAEVTKLQKGLGVSRGEAKGIRDNMSGLSREMKNNAINSADMLKSFNTLNEQFGTAATTMRDDIVGETAKLMKLTGMSAQSAGNFAKFSNISGKNMKTVTTEARRAVVAAEAEGGARLNINKTLDEAGKIGGQVSAQLAGNPAKIAKAVALAKQFGMELEKVAAAGNQLLNFQDSIGKELEAELLLGKSLNLEQARLAALTGDYETLIKEINREVGSYADFTKMNVLQQKALAESVGMTVDQLSDQLLAKANLNELAEEARLMGDEDLAKQLEARSAQEKFNDTVAQLKQIFVDLVGGPFGDVLNAIGTAVSGMSVLLGYAQDFGAFVGGWGSGLGDFLAGLGPIGKALKGLGMLAVVFGAYKAFSALASIPVVGPILGAAAAAAVIAAGSAALNGAETADDATFEGGGYGKRTLLEEGRITRFNDNDTIIAGTRLGRANDMISEGAATPPRTTPAPQPIIIDNTVVHDSFQSSNYYNGPRSREKANSAIFD